MRCPFCRHEDTKVLDSRPAEEGCVIRRRRECTRCGRRFTTYERIDEAPLMVVKKDGRREPFDRGKLLTGLTLACRKRPVAAARIHELADEVERELRARAELEVASRDIGELVIEKLRALDEVAYVRFASVYREFKDVHGFVREIEKLLNHS
ncbi:MAG: transcriptional regulator NrdR [Armatimonadetes bacterium]|nr:transcriptional regulator NrdR [Armatimonadota bacterium]